VIDTTAQPAASWPSSQIYEPGDAVAHRIATCTCAVLLTGETGTGKGHLARWLHAHGGRAAGPFVPVNCGAIPADLIDSHLFGHAKGSVLLLDEVGELPSGAQLRLLRLLEEREVQPVGYSRPLTVDVRIIAATNGDLAAKVRAGTFRADLYYRLDVVCMNLKPLRERVREIPMLLAVFNAEFAAMHRQPALTFDRQAMRTLERYDWPGNVRELRSVVERLHVLCGATGRTMTVQDLREYGQVRVRGMLQHAGEAAPRRLQELRGEVVAEALQACRGNVSRAATTLGVHRSTIYRWLADERLSA
jgi:DNA-binding NtrC family response regulator